MVCVNNMLLISYRMYLQVFTLEEKFRMKGELV